MLDLNHLLLFVASVSPVIVLIRTARNAALNRGWWLAAIAVLIVTALAWLLSPDRAGYIGAGAWLALLLLPMVGLRQATEAVAVQRFSTARWILGLLRFLHPSRALRDERDLLRALQLAQRGSIIEADAILQSLSRQDGVIGRRATAWRFFIHGEWENLRAWSERNIPRLGLGEDATLLPLYFRSLGELGQRDELVRQCSGRISSLLSSVQYQSAFLLSLLTVLSFCGRGDAVERILQTRLRRLPERVKNYWLATSQSAAAPLSAPNESTVDRLAHAVLRRHGSILPAQNFRATPAVIVIILLNVIVFLVEVSLGGSMNPLVLHRLGALEPTFVLQAGQYWRLLSATFLHYGPLHLFVNVYALYVLGPALETSFGTLRFTICYFLSGLGSSAGVVALWRFGLTQTESLVGASGAVMGVVGAWAAFLALHRHVPMARRRFVNIVLIIVIQTAFDFSTPQISLGAHLCGLTSGLILGLLLAPRRDLI